MRNSLTLCTATFLALTLGSATVAQNRDSDGEVISIIYGHSGNDNLIYFKRNLVSDFKTSTRPTTQTAHSSDALLNTTGLHVQMRQKQHQDARVNPQSFALD